MDWLETLKKTFACTALKYTAPIKSSIQRIAWCGGSGSFLIGAAKKQQADVFLTSDVKYHDFFEADNKLVIVDIGHYESEQFTVELFAEKIAEKKCNFAVLKSKHSTNPVNYL